MASAPQPALDRLRACPTGKVKHFTHESALQHIGQIRQAGRRKKGHVLNAYRCPQCQCWHVGHQSQRRNRQLRKLPASRKGGAPC